MTNSSNSRQKRIFKNLKTVIAKHGWMVLGVDATPTFAYTIGLRNKGLPDLIMFGIPYHLATEILNDTARLMINQKKPFEAGEITHDIANYPTGFIQTEGKYRREYMAQAYNYYGDWDFDALQLILSDHDNRFPWQAGFTMGSAQPIVGSIAPSRQISNDS